MAAIRIRWRPAASGRSREVTNGSFVAAKLTEGHRASAAASGKSGCPVWVAMRLTSLRVRRRNVVVEFSLPGSSRSSPSADDPLRPLSFAESCHSAFLGAQCWASFDTNVIPMLMSKIYNFCSHLCYDFRRVVSQHIAISDLVWIS